MDKIGTLQEDMNHKFEITKMQMKHNMEMNEMKCKLIFLEALLYIVVLISFIVLNWWRLCIYIRSIIALMYRILVPVVYSHFILL
jgi:hypothetical protein